MIINNNDYHLTHDYHLTRYQGPVDDIIIPPHQDCVVYIGDILAGPSEHRSPLPDQFLCQITKKKLRDPCITSNGETCERKALQKRGDENFFPNLALKKIISDHLMPTGNTNGFPNEYICPISLCVMKDPVVASDGNSYERDKILNYLNNSNKSPLNPDVVLSHTIYPNTALKELIAQDPEAQKSLQEDDILESPPANDHTDPFNGRHHPQVHDPAWYLINPEYNGHGVPRGVVAARGSILGATHQSRRTFKVALLVGTMIVKGLVVLFKFVT